MYLNNCFSHEDTDHSKYHVAITWLPNSKHYTCFKRPSTHHRTRNVLYSRDAQAVFTNCKSLLSSSGWEKWHRATSIECVSVSISILRGQNCCNYIVTHNVLADVGELVPKAEGDKYDERIG